MPGLRRRIILFGALQILFSQIQDIDRIWLMSVIATIMSFTYSGIGLGLSIAKDTGAHLVVEMRVTSEAVVVDGTLDRGSPAC